MACKYYRTQLLRRIREGGAGILTMSAFWNSENLTTAWLLTIDPEDPEVLIEYPIRDTIVQRPCGRGNAERYVQYTEPRNYQNWTLTWYDTEEEAREAAEMVWQ